jgi:hypothetical protein
MRETIAAGRAGSQMARAFSPQRHRENPSIVHFPSSYLLRASEIKAQSSVFEESSVLLDERLFVLRNVVESMDGIRGAGRDARAAVDALHRFNKKLSRFFETGFILLGMDAISGANIDAKGILDAGIGDYIGHDEGSP